MRLRRQLGTVIAFSGGVVVAVALFDVLPEAARNLGNVTHASWLIGVGLPGVFLANRFVVLQHRDDRNQAKPHQRRHSRCGRAAVPLGARRAGDRARPSSLTRDLFLSATDLLPEAHREHPSKLRVALTVAGFAFIFGAVWLATNVR